MLNEFRFHSDDQSWSGLAHDYKLCSFFFMCVEQCYMCELSSWSRKAPLHSQTWQTGTTLESFCSENGWPRYFIPTDLNPLPDGVVWRRPAVLRVVEPRALWRPVGVVLRGRCDVLRGNFPRLHSQRLVTAGICRDGAELNTFSCQGFWLNHRCLSVTVLYEPSSRFNKYWHFFSFLWTKSLQLLFIYNFFSLWCFIFAQTNSNYNRNGLFLLLC